MKKSFNQIANYIKLIILLAFFFNLYSKNIFSALNLLMHTPAIDSDMVSKLEKKFRPAKAIFKKQKKIGYIKDKNYSVSDYCTMQYIFSPSVLTLNNAQKYNFRYSENSLPEYQTTLSKNTLIQVYNKQLYIYKKIK